MPRVRGCTLVIFGATGDLTERKLMPALFRLARERCFGGDFQILGVSRGDMSDGTFRSKMREAVSASLGRLDAGDRVVDVEPAQLRGGGVGVATGGNFVRRCPRAAAG